MLSIVFPNSMKYDKIFVKTLPLDFTSYLLNNKNNLIDYLRKHNLAYNL